MVKFIFRNKVYEEVIWSNNLTNCPVIVFSTKSDSGWLEASKSARHLFRKFQGVASYDDVSKNLFFQDIHYLMISFHSYFKFKHFLYKNLGSEMTSLKVIASQTFTNQGVNVTVVGWKFQKIRDLLQFF